MTRPAADRSDQDLHREAIRLNSAIASRKTTFAEANSALVEYAGGRLSFADATELLRYLQAIKPGSGKTTTSVVLAQMVDARIGDAIAADVALPSRCGKREDT